MNRAGLAINRWVTIGQLDGFGQIVVRRLFSDGPAKPTMNILGLFWNWALIKPIR
jgi:hypothetical protein